MEHGRVTSTMLQTAAVCAWGSVQGSYAWRKVESQLLEVVSGLDTRNFYHKKQ